MKKNYITPCIVSSLQIKTSVICVSGVTGGGMGYGGEDSGGTMTPSAKERDEEYMTDEEIQELMEMEEESGNFTNIW